ncbi:MAG TPA: hypothetical protein P5172_07890 [Syntrophales bacterium]|jgi:hypothetical protein|nr:hypothetical protein [Syntrophales bacterium]
MKRSRDARIDNFTISAVPKGVVWSHWIWTFQMLRVFRQQVFKFTGQPGWFTTHIRIGDQLFTDGVNGTRLFVYERGRATHGGNLVTKEEKGLRAEPVTP